MIELKSAVEIDQIALGGEIIGALFSEIAARVVPGVSTGQLDQFAEDFIRSHSGATPAFKGLYGFPASLCTSINEEVVHGIPSDRRVLKEGDVLSVDVGVRKDGWYSDSARTFPVGEINAECVLLLEATRTALDRAIEAAVPGNRVGDIGHAIEMSLAGSGLSIIRDLVGHGVGRSLHEDPQIPNLGEPGRGPELKEGMVLAIEPMIALGTYKIRTLSDRWTVVTTDGSASAHFEHTVAVTRDGPRILTAGRAVVETN
jgi:methionyl aminopeptidase